MNNDLGVWKGIKVTSGEEHMERRRDLGVLLGSANPRTHQSIEAVVAKLKADGVEQVGIVEVMDLIAEKRLELQMAGAIEQQGSL